MYGSRPRKIDQEELEVEAKWIARRLERKKKIQVDYDPDPLVTQVMVVLDLIKNQYFEVRVFRIKRWKGFIGDVYTHLQVQWIDWPYFGGPVVYPE